VAITRSFAAFVVLITPLSILLTNVLVPGDWQIAVRWLCKQARKGPAVDVERGSSSYI
jgi:hypothetical protein